MTQKYDETQLKAMKVQELKEILGGLGQSQAGLKAELVTRVLETQNAAAAPEPTSATSAPAEEAPVAPESTPAPASTTIASEAPAPDASAATGPAAPEKPALDVDAELEKRKARAAKFGTGNEDSSVDKKLERAKRFGTGADSVAASGLDKLDQALSDRRERRGGRRGGRGGRRGGRGGGGGSSSGGAPGGSSESKPKPASSSATGYAKPSDPAELEKQAKRAARFQTGPDDAKKQKV